MLIYQNNPPPSCQQRQSFLSLTTKYLLQATSPLSLPSSHCSDSGEAQNETPKSVRCTHLKTILLFSMIKICVRNNCFVIFVSKSTMLYLFEHERDVRGFDSYCLDWFEFTQDFDYVCVSTIVKRCKVWIKCGEKYCQDSGMSPSTVSTISLCMSICNKKVPKL